MHVAGSFPHIRNKKNQSQRANLIKTDFHRHKHEPMKVFFCFFSSIFFLFGNFSCVCCRLPWPLGQTITVRAMLKMEIRVCVHSNAENKTKITWPRLTLSHTRSLVRFARQRARWRCCRTQTKCRWNGGPGSRGGTKKKRTTTHMDVRVNIIICLSYYFSCAFWLCCYFGFFFSVSLTRYMRLMPPADWWAACMVSS